MIRRVLVTGSRGWVDEQRLITALDAILTDCAFSNEYMILVHGDCPRGADKMADKWAVSRHVAVERWPANWERYGKSAGYRRNSQMVNTNPVLCVAFIHNASAGATMTADLSESKGIDTVRFLEG